MVVFEWPRLLPVLGGSRERVEATTLRDRQDRRAEQKSIKLMEHVCISCSQVNLFKRNSVYVSTIFVGAFAFGIGFDLAMTKVWEVGCMY